MTVKRWRGRRLWQLKEGYSRVPKGTAGVVVFHFDVPGIGATPRLKIAWENGLTEVVDVSTAESQMEMTEQRRARLIIERIHPGVRRAA